MDAVEYLETLQRMCRSNMECTTCTIYKVVGQECGLFSAGSEKLVSTITSVENWAKEHPVRTRQSVFLERYPNAKTDEDGVLSICPDYIEGSCRKYEGVGCNGCRRKYWGQEAQDDDD
nr:MAG TPA: hypothetical protein [Caudoviricetes sp.]